MIEELDNNEMNELYQSMVLQHSKKPKNFGKIECSCHSYGKNPSCGDELNIYMDIKNEIIENISFIGEGCALSVSATSLLTEKIKGKNIEDTKKLLNDFSLFITDGIELDKSLEPLHIFKGVKNFPLRIKCVMLSCRTIQNIIN